MSVADSLREVLPALYRIDPSEAGWRSTRDQVVGFGSFVVAGFLFAGAWRRARSGTVSRGDLWIVLAVAVLFVLLGLGILASDLGYIAAGFAVSALVLVVKWLRDGSLD